MAVTVERAVVLLAEQRSGNWAASVLDLIYLAARVAFAFMLLTLIVVGLMYAASFVVCVAVFVGVAFGGVLVTSSFVSPVPFWMQLAIAAASAAVTWRLLIYGSRQQRRRR